jgi:hypothetical protein
MRNASNKQGVEALAAEVDIGELPSDLALRRISPFGELPPDVLRARMAAWRRLRARSRVWINTVSALRG